MLFLTLKKYLLKYICLHQVDLIAYADEVAEQIGCRPDIFKLFLKDPVLGIRCLFGPCAPYQYRLMGPGCWDGAKKALEDIERNITLPSKAIDTKDSSNWKLCLGVAFAFVIVAVLMKLWLNGM